jgi:hypothetical protein
MPEPTYDPRAVGGVKVAGTAGLSVFPLMRKARCFASLRDRMANTGESLTLDPSPVAPRPAHWPYRADPPGRYWGNYQLYQMRGGRVRLDDDIRGFTAGNDNQGDISRFYFFCLAFDQLMKEGIKGDVAELGTYKGHTATMLATMARRMGTTAWILDTFEGFNQADLQGVDAGHKMEFADTSLDHVRALVGDANVRFIKGYFPESACQLPENATYSLVHIDCDLYIPISHALRYFYPRLVPGGYLIVHDYASLAWDGAERAVDEFFLDKPEAVIPLTDGCGSAVIRKARAPGERVGTILRRRAALFTSDWTSAGKGALHELLASGWSGPEDFGVWGVGESHILDLTMTNRPTDDVVIEVDGSTALVGTRTERAIGVYAGGERLATWHFSMRENRAKRSVTVPATAVVTGAWGQPMISLEFRPVGQETVHDLDRAQGDTRVLGLAFCGIRRADPT